MPLSFQQLRKGGAQDTGASGEEYHCGLGTDGRPRRLSLFQEMKIFRSVMNLTWGVPLAEPAVMPAKTILAMATRGGQVCLGGDPGRDGKIFREQGRI